MKFVGKYTSAILALVGLVAIVGVACGGDDEEAAAPAAAPAAQPLVAPLPAPGTIAAFLNTPHPPNQLQPLQPLQP